MITWKLNRRAWIDVEEFYSYITTKWVSFVLIELYC